MYYIKLTDGSYQKIEDIKLVPTGVKLYVMLGENTYAEVVQQESRMAQIAAAAQAPVMQVKDDDPIKELTATVREMAGSLASIKQKEQEIQEKIAAYKEMGQKGLYIPNTQVPATSPAGEDLSKSSLRRVNLAVQGKRLMESRFYPKYQIKDEKTRYDVAKYMCLFIKGGILQQGSALREFWDTYTPIFEAEGKTNIGDSGNTFPVTNTVEAEILAFAREVSIALQFANVVDMAAEKQTYPAQQTGTTVSWGNTTSASDATVADVELSAKELSAYASVLNTTLDDSPSDIVSWLFADMAEASGLELDNVMWNGDGSSTYGSVSGIFLTAGYSVALGSTSTAFSQITSTALSQMIMKLNGLKKQGARFFMHGEILHYVRTLSDTNGRPIFLETVGSSIPPAIWGYPYTESTKCPSTSAANTFFVCFGNLKYFFVGRRAGVTNLQVNPYEKWTTNRTCFKVYSRWGLKTGLANGLVRLRTASS
jgi:HK97 family phage major capsid protein